MTDRTGGSSLSNHAHCQRGENYEEEDELVREGEDVGVLEASQALAMMKRTRGYDARI